MIDFEGGDGFRLESTRPRRRRQQCRQTTAAPTTTTISVIATCLLAVYCSGFSSAFMSPPHAATIHNKNALSHLTMYASKSALNATTAASAATEAAASIKMGSVEDPTTSASPIDEQEDNDKHHHQRSKAIFTSTSSSTRSSSSHHRHHGGNGNGKIRVVNVEKHFGGRVRYSSSSTIPKKDKNSSGLSTESDEPVLTRSSTDLRRERYKRRIPKHKRRSSEKDAFDWLNWVYHQWKDTPVGHLDEYVMSQMAASIPKLARRKNLREARYAEQALVRLIREAETRVETSEDIDVKQLPVSKYLTLASFNSAMDAYGKIGKPDGVQRILRKMEELHRSDRKRELPHFSHLEPDEFSMCILASAWAKSRAPNAADQVEAVLKYMDMKDIPINTNVFNSVLHAIAISQDTDKALRAEDIVKSMVERSEKNGEDCYPDVYTFQSLIQAWAYSPIEGAPQRCEQILRQMDEEAEKTKRKSLRPNAYCYTTLIHAWSRSSQHGKARNASRLLNELFQKWTESGRKKTFKPNVRTYTATLNACARPALESEKEDAFNIGQQTMDKLLSGIHDKPNFLSYAAFLAVCETTLGPGPQRDEAVQKTFEMCVRDRMVCQTVLYKLSSAASPDLLDRLTGSYRDDDGTIHLPDSWSLAVNGERPIENAVKYRPFQSPISASSTRRLAAVEELNNNPDGIAWANKPLSSKQIT